RSPRYQYHTLLTAPATLGNPECTDRTMSPRNRADMVRPASGCRWTPPFPPDHTQPICPGVYQPIHNATCLQRDTTISPFPKARHGFHIISSRKEYAPDLLISEKECLQQ